MSRRETEQAGHQYNQNVVPTDDTTTCRLISPNIVAEHLGKPHDTILGQLHPLCDVSSAIYCIVIRPSARASKRTL
jgi:hypothetical protein